MKVFSPIFWKAQVPFYNSPSWRDNNVFLIFVIFYWLQHEGSIIKVILIQYQEFLKI